MAVRFKNAESYVNGKMVRGDLFFDFVSSVISGCSVDASWFPFFQLEEEPETERR